MLLPLLLLLLTSSATVAEREIDAVFFSEVEGRPALIRDIGDELFVFARGAHDTITMNNKM